MSGFQGLSDSELEELVFHGEEEQANIQEPTEPDVEVKAEEPNADLQATEEASVEVSVESPEPSNQNLELGEEEEEEEELPEEDDKELETTDQESIDYKAMHEELLQPLKASGKTLEVKSVAEARKLMQFGVDYHKNMNKISTHTKMFKTLENAGLANDPDKLNTLIDISNGNVDAIKSLLKTLDVEDFNFYKEEETSEEVKNYTPKDYRVSDEEVAVSQVIDRIKSSPSFDKTINLVSKQWDTQSRDAIVSNPQILEMINIQMGNGEYDRISAEVDRLRLFGDVPQGMSDIDVYGIVAKSLLQGNGDNQSIDTSHSAKPAKAQLPNNPNRVASVGSTQSKSSTDKPFSKMTNKEIDSFLGL